MALTTTRGGLTELLEIATRITNPINGQTLIYQDGFFINASGEGGSVTSVSVVSANGFTGTVTNPTTTPAITLNVSALNATKIAGGTVDNTEFGFLNGVTSSIQTQFSGKQGNLQFQNQGVDVGTSGGIATINFTGGAVVASATGTTLTVRCSALGTVTSVSASGGDGVTTAVINSTTTPNITIDISGLPTSKIAGGAFGRSFFATTTTAAATSLLGAGTVGTTIFQAATTAAVQAIIDASAKQNIIQYQDEGVDVGTAGGITTVNFTGGDIQASATGSTLTVRASSSTNAQTISVSAEAGDTSCFFGIFDAASGNLQPKTVSTMGVNADSVFAGIGTATPASRLHLAGNISAPSWTTNGIGFRIQSGTYTDTTSTGTVANNYINVLTQPTLTATNSATYTNAATFVINNAPNVGSNIAITNPMSLYVPAGKVRIDDPIGFGSVNPVSTVHIGGTQTRASWTTTGCNFASNANTTTDTTGSGTIASRVGHSFGIPTFASTASATVTDAANVYIAGAPAAGTNTTLPTTWSLWIDSGNIRLDGLISTGSTIRPQANDGGALGAGTLGYSDLFLASGGTVNWANGNVVVTHSAGVLDLSTGALKINSISNDTGLAAGTYTPTLTNVANIAASTAYQAQYMRVGNTVTVAGKVDVDPTLTATSTQLGITIPVASNFGATEDCAGTAFAPAIAGMGAAVLADTTNDRAQLQFISSDVANQAMYFTFTYQVI